MLTNFQRATRNKLRFPTPTGNVSVERLWDYKGAKLPLLGDIITSLAKDLDISTPSNLDFLKSNAPRKDWRKQLMFDVAKEVYLILQDEAEANANEKANKEHNEKILALIAKKQEDSLEAMTEDELRKMLK